MVEVVVGVPSEGMGLFKGVARQRSGRGGSVSAGKRRGAPLMALRPLARVATQRRCSGSALGGRRGEAGDGTRRAAASGAAGVLGTRSAWVRARGRASTHAGQAQGRARAQPGNRGEGRGKKKGEEKKKRKGKRKRRRREKERKKKKTGARQDSRRAVACGRQAAERRGMGLRRGKRERARFGWRKREKKRWNDDY